MVSICVVFTCLPLSEALYDRDTVSSVGAFRDKNLPLTDTADHICYIRHALALDERRVKFLPEFIYSNTAGGQSPQSPETGATGLQLPQAASAPPISPIEPGSESGGAGQSLEAAFDLISKIGSSNQTAAELEGERREKPRVKEVWFAGTHSDMSVFLLWLFVVALIPHTVAAGTNEMRTVKWVPYLSSGWLMRLFGAACTCDLPTWNGASKAWVQSRSHLLAFGTSWNTSPSNISRTRTKKIQHTRRCPLQFQSIPHILHFGSGCIMAGPE